MVDIDVRERVGQPRGAGGPAFDLLVSKLRRPRARGGTVRRPALIERLAPADHPIVSVVAPAGYRKMTLLSQCAEANGPAFAWVSVDEPENDPKVLLTYVAALLRLAALVATGSPGCCLQWSVGWALAAGATQDEIADVLLAIAPVAGLGRIAAAAPDVATALDYDITAALEELDDG